MVPCSAPRSDLAAADDLLQPVDVVGRLLQERRQIGRQRRAAAELGQAAIRHGEPRDAREPFLELVVEVLLGLARLQVEEAQDQRAREAEQRGAEGRAHARTAAAAGPP